MSNEIHLVVGGGPDQEGDAGEGVFFNEWGRVQEPELGRRVGAFYWKPNALRAAMLNDGALEGFRVDVDGTIYGFAKQPAGVINREGVLWQLYDGTPSVGVAPWSIGDNIVLRFSLPDGGEYKVVADPTPDILEIDNCRKVIAHRLRRIPGLMVFETEPKGLPGRDGLYAIIVTGEPFLELEDRALGVPPTLAGLIINWEIVLATKVIANLDTAKTEIIQGLAQVIDAVETFRVDEPPGFNERIYLDGTVSSIVTESNDSVGTVMSSSISVTVNT